MTALAKQTAHLVVLGSTVHSTQQHVFWSVQWDIIVQWELRHHLIIHALRDISIMRQGDKA